MWLFIVIALLLLSAIIIDEYYFSPRRKTVGSRIPTSSTFEEKLRRDLEPRNFQSQQQMERFVTVRKAGRVLLRGMFGCLGALGGGGGGGGKGRRCVNYHSHAGLDELERYKKGDGVGFGGRTT